MVGVFPVCVRRVIFLFFAVVLFFTICIALFGNPFVLAFSFSVCCDWDVIIRIHSYGFVMLVSFSSYKRDYVNRINSIRSSWSVNFQKLVSHSDDANTPTKGVVVVRTGT